MTDMIHDAVKQATEALATLKGLADALGVEVERPPEPEPKAQRQFQERFSLLDDEALERAQYETEREMEELRRKRQHRDFHFARFIRGLVLDRVYGPDPAHWKGAEFELKTVVEATQRQLREGVETAGGYLVPPEYAAEVIELLREQAVVRQAGPTIINVRSNRVLIPRVTTGTTAYWVGEGADIPESAMQFAQAALDIKDLASLVHITRDLLMDADVSVEQMVREDLAASLALKEDEGFLLGNGTGNAPVGIGNIPGFQSFAAGAEFTPEAFTGARLRLRTANIPFDDRCVWLCDPLVEKKIVDMKDDDGHYYFMASLMVAPEVRILGKRVLTTSVLPDNELWLVNMRHIVVGQRMGLEIAISGEAGQTFYRNTVAVRAIMRVGIQSRHPAALVKVTGIP